MPNDIVAHPIVDRPIVDRQTPWTRIILVCGKCSRKLDGGYGPKQADSLRTALKHELKQAGHRRTVRVVETKCFGLCPKKAVVALDSHNPGHLLTIPRGTPPNAALDRLIKAGPA